MAPERRLGTDDWKHFGNTEPLRVQGNHIWQNDGMASRLHVR